MRYAFGIAALSLLGVIGCKNSEPVIPVQQTKPVVQQAAPVDDTAENPSERPSPPENQQ